MRSFVIGDIHGAYAALKECLEKSQFDYQKDHLISLGDICDGWPETAQCIDELLKIKNLTVVLGNHDRWALDWMNSGVKDMPWLTQGGRQTIESYNGKNVPQEHIDLLNNAPLYFIDKENRLFVHAGLDPSTPIEEQGEDILLWDRTFFNKIKVEFDHNLENTPHFTSFNEVYIGHTPIHRYGFLKPIKVGEVWLMDTGAAWEGILSMMDLNNNKIFTSKPPVEVYPKGSGRF